MRLRLPNAAYTYAVAVCIAGAWVHGRAIMPQTQHSAVWVDVPGARIQVPASQVYHTASIHSGGVS